MSDHPAPDDTSRPLPEAAIPAAVATLERLGSRAFKAANRAHLALREDPFGLSMSALGGCTRQAAYRMAHTPPTDPELIYDDEANEALIGTWIHAGFLPYLAQQLHQATIELPVTLHVDLGESKVTVPGTADLHTHALGGGVVDLKTMGAYQAGERQRQGARDEHRMQVWGYALAAQQAGLPVAWVAWYYMQRDTGTPAVIIEQFGPDQATAVHQRLRELHQHSTNPDQAPRTERGPGLSFACDTCPWLKRCWGKDAEPGDTRAMAVHDAVEIAFAAAKYLELRAQKKEIEREMEQYSAMIGTPAKGRYGDADVVYGGAGEDLDKHAAYQLLELHGIQPPMKERRLTRIIRWGKKGTSR